MSKGIEILKRKLAQKNGGENSPHTVTFDFSSLLKRLEEVVLAMGIDRGKYMEQLEKVLSEIPKRDMELLKEIPLRDTKLLEDIAKNIKNISIPTKVTLANKNWLPDKIEADIKSDSKLLNVIGTMRKEIVLALSKQFDISRHEDPEHALAVVLVDPETKTRYRSRGSMGGGGGGGTTMIDGFNSMTPFSKQTVVSAGTPIQITAAKTACKKVTIQAGAESGNLFVGDSKVKASTGKGFIIFSRQAWSFSVNDLSKLWFDSTSSGKTFNGHFFN